METTVMEIKQTSRTAAEKAASVVRAGDRVEELDRIGGAAVDSTLAGINDVIAEVNDINAKIGELAERARQIGRITETVKDLADQSNMLALNAAIEAVRSGEHGKGFSVVAREIRALADQSIEATNGAREILGEVTRAIRMTIARSDTGMQKMEAGLVQARASGSSLRELTEILRSNHNAARQISAVVTQQDAGVAQMSSAVGDLSRMMDGIVDRLDTTNRAVDDLRAATSKVIDIVRRFRAD
jgi:methyl-accepting chemotaxis protein